MKKALLITTDKYPNGDAGAIRAHALAKLLQSIGYEITVLGLGPSTNFQYLEEDGVSYTSLRSSKNSTVSKIKDRLNFKKRVQRVLLDEEKRWDVILVSLVSGAVMKKLKAFARKRGVILLHDSVEWYSPEQFSIGKLHPTYISMDLRNCVYIDKTVRVIAISSYLERHFQNRGVAAIRIPAVLNVRQTPCDKCVDREKIVFSYAGSPGKKDYLRVIIEGFATMQASAPFELRLIGVTKKQLVSLCDVDPAHIDKLGERLCCMGRIPREDVLRELSRSDFTVLIRSEEQRYAKAGFPTKFAESLATATPVISNATSDILDYLQDGVNGYLVSACSSEALTVALQKAICLSYEERVSMQQAARRTAEEYFDYARYEQILKQFIEK